MYITAPAPIMAEGHLRGVIGKIVRARIPTRMSTVKQSLLEMAMDWDKSNQWMC